jgi:hypothetical protein
MLCGVNPKKISPMHVSIVEDEHERGLHHHEVGRDIEFARRVERRVTIFGDFAPRRLTLDARNIGRIE